VFGAQARFPLDRVERTGRASTYVRVGDEGGRITQSFCPDCGSTVYYQLEPDLLGVPVGAFADPTFPAPRVSVYESRRHPWVTIPDGPNVEHYD